MPSIPEPYLAMKDALRHGEFLLRHAERFAKKARGTERLAWERYCDDLRQLPAKGLPVEWPHVNCEAA